MNKNINIYIYEHICTHEHIFMHTRGLISNNIDYIRVCMEEYACVYLVSKSRVRAKAYFVSRNWNELPTNTEKYILKILTEEI